MVDWHDRNLSVTQIQYVANGVGPHGLTLRATYTCPSGRKASLVAASVIVLRVTAAAPVGIVDAFVLPGGTARLPHAHFLDNNVGAYYQNTIGFLGILSAGEIVRIYTADGSTGGTLDYRIDCLINEFDA